VAAAPGATADRHQLRVVERTLHQQPLGSGPRGDHRHQKRCRAEPATFFQGTRAVQAAQQGAEVDGRYAHRFQFGKASAVESLSLEQLARRDQLEQEIERLRQTKSQMSEDAYYEALEPLLIEMARLYAEPKPEPVSDNET
jgi:hypothetical protein